MKVAQTKPEMLWHKDEKCLKYKDLGVVRIGFPFDHYLPEQC